MTRRSRDLTPAEADLWERVAQTVTPMAGRRAAPVPPKANPNTASVGKRSPAPQPVKLPRSSEPVATTPVVPASDMQRHGLDSGWDRKLARGLVAPDFTLDLHGATLDAAYGRLMHGLTQAKAMGARMVLLVTGKPRPVHAADRAIRRGAIRAKVVDWLASSEHAHDIAAIRGAHRRHGGQGALYIILKRRRV